MPSVPTHGYISHYLFILLPSSVSGDLLGQVLNMVIQTLRLQSLVSKHTLMNIKCYHCQDKSTVSIIVTLMKCPGLESH